MKEFGLGKLGLLLLLVFSLLVGQSNADQLKFQQVPLDGITVNDDLMYFGHDELSSAYLIDEQYLQYEGCFMADDFADTFSSPVIRIKWWGSYLENIVEDPIVGFMIVWEGDIPAEQSGMGYSTPDGIPQGMEIVIPSSLSTPRIGEFTEKVFSYGGPPCNETLYEYEALLANPFYQLPDTVYWVKIVALFDYDIAVIQNLVWNILPKLGISFCEFLNMSSVEQMNIYPEMQYPLTRWGWHNRDYTITDPYASPNVKPGEYVEGTVIFPDGVTIDVWHFQDDAVSGVCSLSTNPDSMWIEQWDYREQYYQYWGCDGNDVDGPNEIERYSKDLAFELWTEGTEVELDFGDAPDRPYPTYLASLGANHVINTKYGPWLGDATDFPDPETDGQPTATADGDDLDGNDDENGVTIPTLIAGQAATITFTVSSFDGAGGSVEGYIDFDGDGSFTTTASEQVVMASYGDGVHSITVPVPSTAVIGTTYARFRITRAGTVPLGVTGQAPDGEVEDYTVTIEESLDEVVKFQQLPLDGILVNNEAMYFGHDEFSTAYSWYDEAGQFVGYEGCYMADDFADLVNTPVISLRWWGSYILNEDIQHVQRFLIVFEEDVPAVGKPGSVDYVPSHPGDILQSEIVTLNPTTGSPGTGEFTETWVSFGGTPCYEAMYEYKAALKNPFPEEANTVYWLKIVALIDIDPVYVTMLQQIIDSGISMCEIFENPTLYDLPYIPMWGWHNRDYTIQDAYAPPVPNVVLPGEHVQGVVPMPDGTAVEVWHFQDDSVYGDVFVDVQDGTVGPLVYQDPNTWKEQYYKYALPYCGVDVDGPLEIEVLSKDLAFELYTNPCIDASSPHYTNWIKAGQPQCWCYTHQCKGDADNNFSGKNKAGNRVWVDSSDLALFLACWQKKESDTAYSTYPCYCADFDHLFSGKDKAGLRIWVDSGDLTIFLAGWQKAESDPIFGPPVCP